MSEKEQWLRGFYNMLLEQYEPLQAHMDGGAIQDKYESRDFQKLCDILADIINLMDSIEAYADVEGVSL